MSKYRGQRAVVADALVRMAECYQQLGDAESRKIYEQIVRDYADQTDAVALARAQLGSDAPVSKNDIVTRRVWIAPPKADFYGPVSPNGRYIPYVDWAMDGDLFLHDLKTGTNRRLTNTANDRAGTPRSEIQYAEEYSFSRDGKQLVYSWFKDGRYELRLVSLQGTGIPQFRRLFDNEDIKWIGPYDWSPDGKSFAVRLQRTDRNAQIGLVAVQDGSLRVLKSMDWRSSLSPMFFSPDGRYLAYDFPTSATSDQRDVFILAVDGSREIPAVVHSSQDAVMGWSPDGKRLLLKAIEAARRVFGHCRSRMEESRDRPS